MSDHSTQAYFAQLTPHVTHVNVYGVELEAHYDSTGVLAHAFVTQQEPGSVSRKACGPDLIEFLHFSQVRAIEQAIYHQHEREAQREQHRAQAPF